MILMTMESIHLLLIPSAESSEHMSYALYRYVLLKERNMLASEQMRRKAAGEKLPNPSRTGKVRDKPGH